MAVGVAADQVYGLSLVGLEAPLPEVKCVLIVGRVGTDGADSEPSVGSGDDVGQAGKGRFGEDVPGQKLGEWAVTT